MSDQSQPAAEASVAMKSSRSVLVLIALALVVNVVGTWSLPLTDRDETYYSEVAREMIERGDWVVPHVNGQWFLEKPPLFFWAEAAAFTSLGQSEFAARFPSVLAGIATTLAVFGFGISLLRDRRAAFWAAVMFTVCVQSLLQGKAATLDMTLTLCTTLAWWSGWELMSRGGASRFQASAVPRAAWWAVFYLSLGLSTLAKGPVFVLPLATLVLFALLVRRPVKPWIWPTVAGFAAAAVVFALWLIPANIRTGGAVSSELYRRLVAAPSVTVIQGHGGSSMGTYLLTLPVHLLLFFPFFFPWSLQAPWLATRLWRRENRSDADLYLLAGIGLTYLVFSLGRTKLPHYTYPAFPLLALLLAGQWFAARRPTVALRRWTLAIVAVNTVAGLAVAPIAGSMMQPARIWREVEPLLKPETQCGLVKFTEPSAIWYFRSKLKPHTVKLRTDAAMDFLTTDVPRVVIIPTAVADAITSPGVSAFRLLDSGGWGIVPKVRLKLTILANPAALVSKGR